MGQETLHETRHDAFPAMGQVIKRRKGDILRLTLRLDKPQGLKVEAWTDLKGRPHGHEMKRLEGTDTFYRDFSLDETGFFTVKFRYKQDHHAYWTWVGSDRLEACAHVHVDPDYVTRSIVYNAFIRFFGQKKLSKSGKINYGHSGTFDDLKKRLDQIKEMNVDILYLNPIHMIGELYRNYNPHDQFPKYLQPGCPYSIKDYKSIDPELGIDKDHSQDPHSSLSDPMIEFKELVKEAHRRGIKVYMDLVFNHTSHDFVLQRLHPEWFLYKENIKSLDDPYLYPEDAKEGKPWGDPTHTFCPFDHGYWWEDAAQLNWEYMLSPSSNEPPKNPTLKEMYEYFKSIPKYWVKHVGIDGFRCDVAYRVPPDFWRECIAETRELAKQEYKKGNSVTGDVVFIAESYVDSLDELFRAGFTAAYGDYSNKLYSPLTLKGYLDYIYNRSGSHFPDGSLFFIFPECHDFIRNTKKLLGELSGNRLLSERANQSRWVITATVPGIPMIFNGFEKLEWHPVNLFSYSAIDWEADTILKSYIGKVNAIRAKYKALQKGTYDFIETSQGLGHHTQLFCFARRLGFERFIICTNMDLHHEANAVLHLPHSLDMPRRYELHDLLNGRKYRREGHELHVILEPGQSHIFKVKKIE